MPDFAYVNQTNFKPFSYQEMLAPVTSATQAHQALEEAYGELDAQANIVGSLADETNDPIAYRRYKEYESALRAQANTLAANGLTIGSRKALLDLRGRYAKDITPIQNAITRRRELADEQRKALLQNPTLMFERDMNSLSYESSLDRFLENPDYDYGTQYSGALITEQVSKAASNLARELRSAGAGRLDEYTKLFLQNYGLSSKEVLDAINDPNNPKSSRALSAIYDSVLQNVPLAIRERYYNAVKGYATQGFWSAIGQNTATPYEDYGARRKQAEDNISIEERITRGNIPIDIHTILSKNALGKEKEKFIKEVQERFRIKDGKVENPYTSADVMEGIIRKTPFNKDGARAFRLWTDDGRLVTKNAFVQQGRTKTDKELLGKYYDTEIAERAAALGFDLSELRKEGKVPSIRGIVNRLENIDKKGSPLAMDVMKVSFKDNSKVLANLLPQLMNNEEETVIKKVHSFNSEGNIKDTGEIVKLSDFIDKEGNLKGAPLFFAPPNPNTRAVLMKFNGESYMIPTDKLGSLMNTSYSVNIPALREAQKRKDEWITLFGERAYYTSKEGQANEDILDNSGADYLRTVANALSWSADAPVYDISFNSQTQIP